MASWNVQFTPEAIEELHNAIEYYNLQNIALGDDFRIEFERQIQQLISNPFTRSVRYHNVRFALTNRFPYAIHYTIKEELHTIVIQTVLSTFKNPDENWIER